MTYSIYSLVLGSGIFMPQSSSLPLAAPIVINTRPVERAAPLTRYLQAAGLSVVDIPILDLQPLPTSAADIDIMQRWLAGHYQALVIVSPTAAASGLEVWQTLAPEMHVFDQDSNSSQVSTSQLTTANPKKPPSHLIAVGAATAAVLQQAGYQVLQPIIANNEGMLAMPEIQSLQAGDKLLIWRGLGGRRLLVDTLQARGVHIDSIAWYERTQPNDASTHYRQWLEQFVKQFATQTKQFTQQKPIVIISSGTAFEHWSSIVRQTQSIEVDSTTNHLALSLADYIYIVLGERLAAMVADQQLDHWQVEDLAPETILATIRDNDS